MSYLGAINKLRELKQQFGHDHLKIMGELEHYLGNKAFEEMETLIINGIECSDEAFERAIQEACVTVVVEGKVTSVFSLEKFRRLLGQSQVPLTRAPQHQERAQDSRD